MNAKLVQITCNFAMVYGSYVSILRYYGVYTPTFTSLGGTPPCTNEGLSGKAIYRELSIAMFDHWRFSWGFAVVMIILCMLVIFPT